MLKCVAACHDIPSAMCCNVLQCVDSVTECCSVLQLVTVSYSELQCVAVCPTSLVRHVMLDFFVLLCVY